jgi:hypothetical protein
MPGSFLQERLLLMGSLVDLDEREIPKFRLQMERRSNQSFSSSLFVAQRLPSVYATILKQKGRIAFGTPRPAEAWLLFCSQEDRAAFPYC